MATYNYETVLDLCKLVKKQFPTKTIWIYTGYVYDKVNVEFLSYIDMLRDGPYVASKLNLKQFLQGSTNQGYVDCKKSLDAGKRINYKFDE